MCLFIEPLLRDPSSILQLATFSSLSLKHNMQMLLVGLIAFADTVQFAIMGDSPATGLMITLFAISFASNMLVYVLQIYRSR